MLMPPKDEVMRADPITLAAAKKLGGVPDGFSFFRLEWLGAKPEDWKVMKCSGAVFREAKSGPRKGQQCILVKGTEHTAFVTSAEINAEAAAIALPITTA